MSTIIIIGAGPRPAARIVMVQEIDNPVGIPTSYAIFDGAECVGTFEKLSFAKAMLPLIQMGQ